MNLSPTRAWPASAHRVSSALPAATSSQYQTCTPMAPPFFITPAQRGGIPAAASVSARANRRLVGTAVPGMAEVACRVLGGDGVECGAESLMQRLGGARGNTAQLGF